MANGLLVWMPNRQAQAALSILKQSRTLTPDFNEVGAIKHVLKLIANSLSTAKIAPTSRGRLGLANLPCSTGKERESNSVHAASWADGTQWKLHVSVSSILSRSCNKQEATSFWQGCHMKRHMAHDCHQKDIGKP